MKTLYISDLDGTLLRDDATPSIFTKNTVNELSELGMRIAFSTARSVPDVRKIMSNFKLNMPIICMNGTLIVDFNTGKVLDRVVIPRKTVEQIIDIMERFDCPPGIYTYKDDDVDVQYKKILSEGHEKFINDRQNVYRSIKKVDKYDISGEVIFLNMVSNKQTALCIKTELDKIEGIQTAAYADVYYQSFWFVEISGKGADKAAAMNRLKTMFGLEKAVAFGDNMNDITMLNAADLSIAVDNARQEVKCICDKVIPSNMQDGVAIYLLDEYKNSLKAE